MPLRIGTLAKRSGKAPETLRYYERLGLLTPAGRTGGGYRCYDEAAVERLAFVRRAQALGLSLAEVREIVRIVDRGGAPCDHVQAALERHLEEVDTRIAELRALRRSIEESLANATASRPRGACVCRIIESTGNPIGQATEHPEPRHRRRARAIPSSPRRTQ